jgi:hypothetical protein
MLLLVKLQDYLNKVGQGDVSVSLSSLTQFTKDCKESAVKQISKDDRTYRIRMSGLGRHLCQQILERDGHKEELPYNAPTRFWFGDLSEAMLMCIMREAGIDIVDFQKEVELEIAGHKIRGTLDVIIRDESGVEKVWDIKSASDWAFKHKFGFGGYDSIKEDDPFGYVMQGYLYATAMNMPFGGWIVINKSGGQIAVVDAPEWQDEDRVKYMADAEKRVKFLTDPKSKPFKPFPDEFETYRDGGVVRTGNKLMPKPCGFCGHKLHCWPKAEIHGKVTSKAKFPPLVWYTRLKKREL